MAFTAATVMHALQRTLEVLQRALLRRPVLLQLQALMAQLEVLLPHHQHSPWNAPLSMRLGWPPLSARATAAGAAAAAPSAEFGGAIGPMSDAIGHRALRLRPPRAEHQVPEMALVPAHNCLCGGSGYGQGLVSC